MDQTACFQTVVWAVAWVVGLAVAGKVAMYVARKMFDPPRKPSARDKRAAQELEDMAE